MNFRSDNEAGAHPAIIEAAREAFRAGPVHSYGADEWTQKVEHRLRDIFEKPDLVAYPVAVGTAANVLALACCSPLTGYESARVCRSSRPIAAISMPSTLGWKSAPIRRRSRSPGARRAPSTCRPGWRLPGRRSRSSAGMVPPPSAAPTRHDWRRWARIA